MAVETKKWPVVLVALVAILAVAAIASYGFFKPYTSIRNGLYAVFLSNNQVYFGNIFDEDDSKVVLRNIYYIQMKGEAKDGFAGQSDVSLLKLGNELHGPEDWMEINREHVLFIEQLKSDGKVAKAIDAYKVK